MNKFVNSTGVGRVYGANGAAAYASSGSALVDFFYIAGSARNVDKSVLIDKFQRALNDDPNMALKCLFWARDARGGAGERQVFRDLYAYLDQKYPVLVQETLKHVPEYGRWDDLWSSVQNPTNRQRVRKLIGDKLMSQDESYGLLCKWLPRQGNFAAEMRKHLNLSPKMWRKMVVNGSKTVEQKMCARDWSSIDHNTNPSLAASRYSNAFKKHAEEDGGNYAKYLAGFATGESKIKTGVLAPHDIVKNVRVNADPILINAQWDNLQNFLEDSTENILPMIDVSGSMGCLVGGNPNLNCMDVAIGLGAYVALKQPGAFNGMYLTFETSPRLARADITKGVKDMINDITAAPWGGSTNLSAAFDQVLTYAIRNQVPQSDMPTMLIILSDMQMNEADHTFNQTMLEMIQSKYEASGYKMPKLVFWNLNNEYGTTEAGATTANTMLVSGFSPAILKAIVDGTEMPAVPTPLDLVLNVLNSPRYEAISV